MKCSDCVHWSEKDGIVGWGRCLLIRMRTLKDVTDDPTIKACTLQGMLATAPDFGCSLWAAKEDKND